MKRKKKYATPEISSVHPLDRTKELAQIAHAAVDDFSGDFDVLEKSLGMLMLGDYVGWKVLVIIHNKRTLRKYEDVLGIKVREFFPEVGPIAERSMGYVISQKLGNFWKVVSGDVSIEHRRELDGNTSPVKG